MNNYFKPLIIPSTNPKRRNIAGKKSSLSEALLSALASKTAIRLKVRLRLPDVLRELFTISSLSSFLQYNIHDGNSINFSFVEYRPCICDGIYDGILDIILFI